MPNKIEKRPDGMLDVELETGEKFSGDPLEVTQKMAEAHVNTKRWGQEWKAKAETTTDQPNNAPRTASQQPVYDERQLLELGNYTEEGRARARGFKNKEELWKEEDDIRAFKQQMTNNNAADQFYKKHPECPGDQKAVDAMTAIFNENPKWEINANNFEAAHLIAMQRGLYEPVNPNASNPDRPSAPPMLRSNNPEVGSGGSDPYAMPMDQLRAQAIRQQLEPKR